jgi:hypothetical protein
MTEERVHHRTRKYLYAYAACPRCGAASLGEARDRCSPTVIHETRTAGSTEQVGWCPQPDYIAEDGSFLSRRHLDGTDAAPAETWADFTMKDSPWQVEHSDRGNTRYRAVRYGPGKVHGEPERLDGPWTYGDPPEFPGSPVEPPATPDEDESHD